MRGFNDGEIEAARTLYFSPLNAEDAFRQLRIAEQRNEVLTEHLRALCGIWNKRSFHAEELNIAFRAAVSALHEDAERPSWLDGD